MYRFSTYATKLTPALPDLRGAHLVGADGVPVRGAIRMEKGQILCETRHQDAVGLSLLWPVNGSGVLQLETTRLPLRNEPYHLHLELVRHRLMRISMKREEWGLFDYPGMEEIAARIDQSRELFMKALQSTDKPAAAAEYAEHGGWKNGAGCCVHDVWRKGKGRLKTAGKKNHSYQGRSMNG